MSINLDYNKIPVKSVQINLANQSLLKQKPKITIVTFGERSNAHVAVIVLQLISLLCYVLPSGVINKQ